MPAIAALLNMTAVRGGDNYENDTFRLDQPLIAPRS